MNWRAAIGIAALGLCAGVHDIEVVLVGQAPRFQWDGVYTLEQAGRGEKLYAEKCSSCHGPDLNGGEMAPGLIGGEFTSNWNDLTLGDLLDRIRITMPQNAPESLSRDESAAIVAFVLQKGNYPPGKSELPTQTGMLQNYKFLAMKP